MVLCCLFSGEALPDDPRKHNAKQFQVNMMQAPGADPGCKHIYGIYYRKKECRLHRVVFVPLLRPNGDS